MIKSRIFAQVCPLPAASLLLPPPMSPACDVLEEKDEGDADADEADSHGGDDELLQAVEDLLLGAPPQTTHPFVIQVLQKQLSVNV